MKKKIISLALALIVVLSLLPVAAFADQSIPAEVQGTWTGTDGNGKAVTLVIDADSCIVTIQDVFNGVDCSCVLSSESDYFQFQGDGYIMVAFVLSTKEAIIMEWGGAYNGQGQDKVSLTKSFSTIADILATVDGGFPTVSDTSKYWTNGNGDFCYVDGDALHISDGAESVNSNVYRLTDQQWATDLADFNIDNGKLISIYSPDCGGLYTAPHTHTLTEVKTCSATCTEPGVKTAYWVCTDESCGKCFTAETDGTEISAEQLAANYIEAAKGHDFSGTLVQGEGENAGKHAAKCADCDAYGTVIEGVHTEGWVTCTCDQTSDTTHQASPADCTNAELCYKTCICGYCDENETFENGSPNGHSFDTENWTYDETQHWHAATCGHDTEKDSVGNHVDETEKDHKCDVCGYVMSECKDEDKDHKCDVCGKVLSECKDDTGDGKCDICGKDMGAQLTTLEKLVKTAVEVAVKVVETVTVKTAAAVKTVTSALKSIFKLF